MNENKQNQLNQLRELVGKKVTIVKFGEMGFLHNIQAEITDVRVQDYAQYKDMIHVIYKPFRKRNEYIMRIYDHSRIVIWDGYVKVETDMFVNSKTDSNGTTIRESLMSFSSEYIERAKNSIKQQPIIEIKPISSND